MGSRNPDRVDMAIWRGGCETVGQMVERRWDVVSKCERCALQLHTDLRVIIKVKGPQVSLWNRRQRCRKLGCGGQVRFMAKPPGCTYYRDLDAPWPAGRPARGDSGYAGPR